MTYQQAERAVNIYCGPPHGFPGNFIPPAKGRGTDLPNMIKKPARKRTRAPRILEQTKTAICQYHEDNRGLLQKDIAKKFSIERRYTSLHERTCPVSILTFA